jgi:hypothetical protein
MGDRQPRRKTHARPARQTGGDAAERYEFRLNTFPPANHAPPAPPTPPATPPAK